ncbi:MAG: hypothetical protein JW891_13450 [Candidatus Lokiarchaeota archaeon]|nr:hypothetical protein [Candidatus Lokiarchaeota archaeon]
MTVNNMNLLEKLIDIEKRLMDLERRIAIIERAIQGRPPFPSPPEPFKF